MSTTRQARAVFCCTECGYESPKWLGRCPECASWNSFSERIRGANGAKGYGGATAQGPAPVEMAALVDEDEARRPVGVGEFDRVLGGGGVAGSLASVGGELGRAGLPGRSRDERRRDSGAAAVGAHRRRGAVPGGGAVQQLPAPE